MSSTVASKPIELSTDRSQLRESPISNPKYFYSTPSAQLADAYKNLVHDIVNRADRQRKNARYGEFTQ